MTKATVALLLAASTLVAACGDDDDEADGGGGGGAPTVPTVPELVAGLCAKAETCDALGSYASVEACVADKTLCLEAESEESRTAWREAMAECSALSACEPWYDCWLETPTAC